MKSTNMLERLNQELKRRTLVLRIFPNAASCLRLVRALAVETHEGWLKRPAISTWSICASARRRNSGPSPPDDGGAWSTLRYTGLRADHAHHHQPAIC
jgi:transposase-like protein